MKKRILHLIGSLAISYPLLASRKILAAFA